MTRMKLFLVCIAMTAACGRDRAPAGARTTQQPRAYDIGARTTETELAGFNIDINPAGAGLPAGHGVAAEGAAVFGSKCAMCHGAQGEGAGTFPRLVGREPGDSFGFGRNVKLVKTIGNYWPYSTTLFDYVRRAMPLNAPGTLSNAEVYGLTAYLLAMNRIIGENEVMDARSLPRVRMPARDHFIADDRRGGHDFR